MKRYIKPQADMTNVTTSPILQLGSGGTWDPSHQTQEGKQGMTPVSEDNASTIWED